MADKIEAIENDFILKKRGTSELLKVKRRKGTGIQYVLIILVLIMGVGLSSAILSPEQKDEPNAPITGEFQINSVLPTTDQTYPKVARANNDISAFAWTSWEQDGSDWGVYTRAYDSIGNPIGGEILVNTIATNFDQGGFGSLDIGICRPLLVPSNATFVVTWGHEVIDTPSDYEVYAQMYNVSTLPANVQSIGSNVWINTYTQGFQADAKGLISISMTPVCDKGVITWGTFGENGADPHDDVMGDIFAREFALTPSLVFVDTQEWIVNTNTTSMQTDPEVSMNNDGNYVICWTSYHTTNAPDIMARRFSWSLPDGSAPTDSDDFNASQLNVAGSDHSCSVSMLDNNRIAVGWTHDTQIPQTGLDVYIVGIESDRTAPWPPVCGTDPNFMVCPRDQYSVSISSNKLNTWIWTWTDNGMDGSGEGVFGWMGTWSTMEGDVFQVAATTLGSQSLSDVAMSGDGTYAIAWAMEQSPKDAYGRLYNNIPNVPELNNKWTISLMFICCTASIIVITRRKTVQG